MKDDVISRQAAISAVGYYSLHSGDKLLFADKPLKELPSAQPEQNIQWHSCAEPPSDDRSVFIAYGTKGLKSCCIGFYEADNEQWYEQKNFFSILIYDAKYWCDMPELPERWYE